MFQWDCPKVGAEPKLVRVCKLCQSDKVVINQTFRRRIKDSVMLEVKVLRLKCKECKYSWRIYPEGVKDYSSRSRRLIYLGVLMYSAGLSYQKCAGLMECILGRNLESFITIWRDVQQIGERLRRAVLPIVRTGEVVVGLDGAYVRVKGKKQPVIIATNHEDGNTTITVDLGDEMKERELAEFMKKVAKKLGVKATSKRIKGIVTDDLDTYKIISTKLKLPHQVCLAHVKKNLGKRLHLLKKRIPQTYINQVSSVLSPPKLENDQILKELLKDPKLWKHGRKNKHWVALRSIVSDLLRNWSNYTAYLKHPEANLPTTNNKTEQAVGRSKIRYKLTRGFKSKEGVLNFFYLTQYFGMKNYHQIALSC